MASVLTVINDDSYGSSTYHNLFGSLGKGSVSYLPKAISEELVQPMAKKARSVILTEIKVVKYFAIMFDLTPDNTHIDQPTFVVRYGKPNGKTTERFQKFVYVWIWGRVSIQYNYRTDSGIRSRS